MAAKHAHTAVARDGFRVIEHFTEFPTTTGVQCAVAVREVDRAGEYTVTWETEPSPGAALWLFASSTKRAELGPRHRPTHVRSAAPSPQQLNGPLCPAQDLLQLTGIGGRRETRQRVARGRGAGVARHHRHRPQKPELIDSPAT